MKRFFIYLNIVLLLFIGLKSAALDNWTRVTPNNYVDYEDVIGLQDRYGFSFLLKSYNKGQYEPIGGRQIKYTLSQYEIDCQKHAYKIGIIDSYDDDDIFVNGDYNRYAEFQPIVTGTAVSAISSKLCRP